MTNNMLVDDAIGRLDMDSSQIVNMIYQKKQVKVT